ncbi:MAG: TonB-dependent receptor [Phenylobacterium sp.]|uniref:TonB-dependent receptor n=1 Tax=Phenylobacterium sp. TaxID=1871053 RepID=UPI001215E67F|nr:TonB-dependent receptor [Phenylobacterium sp.]TAJ72870.1 MAG: TonB-dependent receptor [Phenylobacterium sp.]
MNIKLSRALCATTALATGLLLSSQALAQSTGTAIVEELVVTGSTGPKNLDGAIVAEREPKSRASITEEFISRQAPGQSVLDTINLLPGVNFTNNDAFGSAGGDITIRGFDGQRIALLQDGLPLNDSGNYAIYSNQQLESDLVSRVTVNLGTTDVDSPTAAAAGGTVNYITKRASKEFGVRAEVGFGSDNFQRYYGTIETGEIGPWGTRAWFSVLKTSNDLFKPHDSSTKPKGEIDKVQYNFRIDQDFGDVGQASLMATYNENRNNFINRISKAQFDRHGVLANGQPESLVSPTVCSRPTPGAGAQSENTAAFPCPTGYYDFNINPSNTGNIRGLSSWNLSDQLTLTVDPAFQYTLANGGGVQAFSETDRQLRGNSTAAGVDLNGDGDILDSVYLYRPNTTNTRRYNLTSSLIWKFADNQNIRVAYTFDKAEHRQTGDAGFVGQDGTVENVFGGKDGEGRRIELPDGTNLRRRDRLSEAQLHQVAAEYRGKFLEDKLLVNVGVRAPFFKRDLNNFCYQRDTFNAYCTTQVGTPVAGTDDGQGRPLVTFPASALNSNAAFQYGQPRKFTRKYDDVLPNVGVSYDVTDSLSVFASYAETLSAPRTDDLYGQKDVDPGPEKAKAYDVGMRYQSGPFLASLAVWRNDFSNRIERVFDEAAGIAFSANVGDVELMGFDGQVGFKPTDELSLYASIAYVDSEIQNNIPGENAGQILQTKGNQLYETPKWQGGVRVQWDPMEQLSLGVQGKFVGDRYTNLTNTEQFNGYTLWDVDARVKLDTFGLKNTYLQGNIRNLFDERYLGDISTNLGPGTALAQPGYRRTFVLTLHVEY